MSADLTECVAAHRAGSLPKQEFLAAMHDLHSRLFEYSPLLVGGDVARIEIHANGVEIVSREGVRFRLDPADRRQPPLEALNFGTFEGDDERMLDRLIGPEDVVFDVGANVGWYALRWARARPECRVLAFEPVDQTRKHLNWNRERNDIKNVETFDFGLSDSEAEATFFVDPGLRAGAATVNHASSPDTQTVMGYLRRLDDVIAEFDVWPNLIKIDVEGGELAVLRGAPKCLHEQRPIVFCEMLRRWARDFGYHPNDIIALMVDAGYECFETVGDRLRQLPQMTDDTVATNFVFLHREQHADARQQLVN